MNCHFKKFKTEVDAEKALTHIKEVRRKYRRDKKPIRYYLCDFCNHYHLTSQTAHTEEIKLLYEKKFRNLLENKSP